MKTTFLFVFSGILLLALTFPSCFKRDFFEDEGIFREEETPTITCVMTGYMCTIDGDIANRITGSIRIDSLNGFLRGISDYGNWCDVVYDYQDYLIHVEHGNNDGRMYFNNPFVLTKVTYTLGNNYEYDMQGTFVNNRVETVSHTRRSIFGNANYYKIDSVIYSNSGNLISYRYREYTGNTLTKTENYAFEYDLTKEYNNALYPSNIFYKANDRMILGWEYSLGERFDPQQFSKNLITRKLNSDNNTAIFENSYTFNSLGFINTLTQEFLSGGFQPTTHVWTYSYSCQ